MDSVSNTGIINGTYNSLPLSVTSNAVVTQLLSQITLVKSADKQIWADGELTYSVTITNNEAEAFSDIVFTDILDITKMTLVANSVQFNGSDIAYTYDGASGTLSVDIPTLETTESGTVTFRVSKA